MNIFLLLFLSFLVGFFFEIKNKKTTNNIKDLYIIAKKVGLVIFIVSVALFIYFIITDYQVRANISVLYFISRIFIFFIIFFIPSLMGVLMVIFLKMLFFRLKK